MGSFTQDDQLRMDEALKERNKQHEVSHEKKAAARIGIESPSIHERKSTIADYLLSLGLILTLTDADSWWKPNSATAITSTIAHMY